MKRSGFWYRGEFFPFMPMAGAEGDNSGSGDGNNGDNSEGQGNNEGNSGNSGQGNDNNNAGQNDTVSRSEYNSVQARLRQAERDLAERKRKEDEAQADAAKKKGEYESLYNKLKSESETEIARLKGQLFERDARDALFNYLSEKHAGHLSQLKWIWPVLATTIKSDMDADAIKAEAKRVTEDYVKDHPLHNAEGGAPGSASRNGNRQQGDALAKYPGIKSMLDQNAPVSGAGGR